MLGHTDKATINQRRPLTPGMRELLATMVQKGRLQKIVMTGIDENRMRALVDRGFAEWHIEFRGYTATEIGKQQL